MGQTIRVMLVDDEPLTRLGVRLILEASDDIEVVAEAGDGSEVVPLVQAHAPDVILMDVRMEGMNGLEATAAVRALSHPPKVIVLTTWDMDDYVMQAIEAGASGFLLKVTDPREFPATIRSVMAGDAVLSPRSTRQVLDHMRKAGSGESARVAREAVETLSEKEREVVVAVGRGLSNAAIAAELHMGEATVKTHLASAQRKMGADGRVATAVMAERAGILPRS